MWHLFLNIGLGVLGTGFPVLIAWGVLYANKVEERRWVARQRALEAWRKTARLRALDEWEARRSARLAELHSPDATSAQRQQLTGSTESLSADEEVDS